MARRCKRVKNFMHCTVKHKRAFDSRSFRTVVPRKDVRITVGCPKGKYSPSRKRCKVGLQTQKIMRRVK